MAVATKNDKTEDYAGHFEDPNVLVDGLEHVDTPTNIVGVFDRLKHVPPEETSRDYLQQIYVHPAGFAVATDAHIMAVLKMSGDGIKEPFTMPTPNVHKTDDITPGVGKVEVQCDHKRDMSGTYEAPDEDFPDASQVVPQYSEDTERTDAMKLNPDYLADLGKAIGDSTTHGLGIQYGPSEDSPVYCEGKYGFGVIMPMRSQGDLSVV